MTINMDAYGIGLGLVILPWLVGMVVSFAFSLIIKIGALR